MPGRKFNSGNYSFGFNGMEKNPELETGNYDFGARMYDSRIGRWWSVDFLEGKYPSISPYVFAGNTPSLFIDFDGNDFGLRINHTNRTIIVVANVYSFTSRNHRQARAGAERWNNKAAVTPDGYTVSFQINAIAPTFPTDEQILARNPNIGNIRNRKKREAAIQIAKNKSAKSQANLDRAGDRIGNLFLGNNSSRASIVSGSGGYVGGTTYAGEFIVTNLHTERGDLGNDPHVVSHEYGHLMGLDDETNRETGLPNEYYSPGGVMEYTTPPFPISDNDVFNILRYARDKLNNGNPDEDQNAKVRIIEEQGERPDGFIFKAR